MRYRRLGSTDLSVSVVGLGTWQLGGEWGKEFGQAEVDAMIDRCRSSGVNLIDTAECYGDHVSESLVGRAIAADRDAWVVATKFGHRYVGRHRRTAQWTPQEVRDQLERSLRALGTDHVDLYQFHSGDDEAFDRDELWEMLRRQVEKGTVRHLGVSLGSNTNLHQTVAASQVGASVVQIVYSRLDREPEEEVLPACARADLGVLARVPLASGLLSGRYRPGARFTDSSDTRSRRPAEDLERRLRQVQRIAAEEVPHGTPMAAWALAWCLRDPAVTAVIPGAKSVEQVAANASAADLGLVREDHPQAVAGP